MDDNLKHFSVNWKVDNKMWPRYYFDAVSNLAKRNKVLINSFYGLSFYGLNLYERRIVDNVDSLRYLLRFHGGASNRIDELRHAIDFYKEGENDMIIIFNKNILNDLLYGTGKHLPITAFADKIYVNEAKRTVTLKLLTPAATKCDHYTVTVKATEGEPFDADLGVLICLLKLTCKTNTAYHKIVSIVANDDIKVYKENLKNVLDTFTGFGSKVSEIPVEKYIKPIKSKEVQ